MGWSLEDTVPAVRGVACGLPASQEGSISLPFQRPGCLQARCRLSRFAWNGRNPLRLAGLPAERP